MEQAPCISAINEWACQSVKKDPKPLPAADIFDPGVTPPRTNFLILPLIASSLSCTIFSNMVCFLLSERCVATSFYQNSANHVSFCLFYLLCATYCTSSGYSPGLSPNDFCKDYRQSIVPNGETTNHFRIRQSCSLLRFLVCISKIILLNISSSPTFGLQPRDFNLDVSRFIFKVGANPNLLSFSTSVRT